MENSNAIELEILNLFNDTLVKAYFSWDLFVPYQI
jgi:hypothetical protein